MKQEKSITDILTNMNTNVSPTERVVSGVAGGALIAYGIKQGGTVGALLSVLGGGLALRGATGHCQVYDAMDVNTADATQPRRLTAGSKKSPFSNSATSSKIHVKKSVTINKSPADLYQFWRNFENLPKFMTHLEAVTVTGEKLRSGKRKRRWERRSNGTRKSRASRKTNASAGNLRKARTLRTRAWSNLDRLLRAEPKCAWF